jgi:hypothetical protein
MLNLRAPIMLVDATVVIWYADPACVKFVLSWYKEPPRRLGCDFVVNFLNKVQTAVYF